MGTHEHEGHWQCLAREHSAELYETSKFVEHGLQRLPRSQYRDAMLERLRRIIEKVESRPNQSQEREYA